jgi:hypothetical protein
MESAKKSHTKKIKRSISLKKAKNKNAIDPTAQFQMKIITIEGGEDQHLLMKLKVVVAAIGRIVNIEGDIDHGQDRTRATKKTLAVIIDLIAKRKPNLTTTVGRLCCRTLKRKE